MRHNSSDSSGISILYRSIVCLPKVEAGCIVLDSFSLLNNNNNVLYRGIKMWGFGICGDEKHTIMTNNIARIYLTNDSQWRSLRGYRE